MFPAGPMWALTGFAAFPVCVWGFPALWRAARRLPHGLRYAWDNPTFLVKLCVVTLCLHGLFLALVPPGAMGSPPPGYDELNVVTEKPTTPRTLDRHGGLQPLKGYDCEHPNARWRMLDLTEPGKCPDTVKDYTDSKSTRMQIIQEGSQRHVKGFQCMVMVKATMTYCDFDSLTYGKWISHDFIPYKLDDGQCQKVRDQQGSVRNFTIHRRGPRSTIVNEDHVTFPVEVGVPGSGAWIDMGYVRPHNGACDGEAFAYNNQMFKHHYRQMVWAFLFREVNGIHNYDTGKVVWEAGLQGDYDAGIIPNDGEEGTIIWEREELKCEDRYSSLYDGTAEIYYRRATLSNSKLNKHYGAIVMVANDVTAQFAGMVLKEPRTVCGFLCYATHTKHLLACPLRASDTPLRQGKLFNPDIPQDEAETQARTGHIYLHQLLGTQYRFAQVQEQLCVLEQSILSTQLAQLSGSQNPYALVHTYGPGHVTTVKGSTAYITECVEVEVTVRDHKNCTEAIPVRYKNNSVYLDPITHTIHDLSAEIPCDTVMPARWKVDDDLWLCAFPAVKACDPPQKINSTLTALNITDQGHGFPHRLGASIYTPSQKAAHRLAQNVFRAREAVLSRLAIGASDSKNSGGTFDTYLTTAELEEIYEGVGKQYFPFFFIFGKAWTTFVGALMVFTMCRIIAGCMWRLLKIYNERGCGFWMLAGLWGTAYAILYAPTGITDGINRGTANAIGDMEAFLPRDNCSRCHGCRGRHGDDDGDEPPSAPQPRPTYIDYTGGTHFDPTPAASCETIPKEIDGPLPVYPQVPMPTGLRARPTVLERYLENQSNSEGRERNVERPEAGLASNTDLSHT